MRAGWERYLERWTSTGLIESANAERVRAYRVERLKATGSALADTAGHQPGRVAAGRRRAAVRRGALGQAFSGGALRALSCCWWGFSTSAGALVAERFSPLSTTLHAVGTICLGAGIFLAGQIFHLEEHWPGGVMLWALRRLGGMGAFARLATSDARGAAHPDVGQR